MDYEILHLSSGRARVRVPFCLTADVRAHLNKKAKKYKITKIEFYRDEKTLSLFFDNVDKVAIKNFFENIEVEKLKDFYENPTLKEEESPYTIIYDALFWRAMSKLFVPLPLRVVRTWWKASRYFVDTLKLLAQRKVSMETLDATAIFVSLLTGQKETASSIMFILELGEDLNSWSEKKSAKELEKSLISAEKEIWLVTNEGNKKISSTDVKKDDIILVSEGNEILFDGVVHLGSASVNESSLTGESFPIQKQTGDKVYSNTVVVNGEIQVKVENPKANGHVHHLIKLIKESEEQGDTYHYKYINLADSLVKYNFLAMGATYALTRNFNKAMSFLLVDYSCALKLSTPVAYLTMIKKLIDDKVIVKNSETLDKFADIDTFVFDKTGTITVSQPYIREVLPFYDYTYEEVVKIGACLEEHIYHPIASAVVSKAEEDGIEHEEMHTELYHIASKGIISHIDDEKVVIGSYCLLKDEGIEITDEQKQLIREKQEQYNLLFLGYKGKLISIFCIDIPLRKEAASVLRELRLLGKKVVLLTGDNEVRTAKILQDVTFDEVHTNMTPVTKFEYIKQERQNGRKVLMIGDGLNDSAALSESDISIVMNESADLSKQISDVVLKSENLESLLLLGEVSKKLREQMNKNVHSTVGVNSMLILLGLTNILPAKWLALLHNLTTFGLVLKNFKVK